MDNSELNELDCLADALWIGSDHPFDLHEAYLCFRSPSEWQLGHKPQRALLYITADSRYKLWLNGHFVGRGPARSYPESQSVDTWEVSEYLQIGENTMAAQVYQPGYSHFSYIHRGAAGLLVSLVCDGGVILTSDNTWRVRRDWSYAAQVPRVSIYGSGIEEKDLKQVDNWLDTDYNDSEWASARIVAPACGAPWLGMHLREIPYSQERDAPMTLLETRRGIISTSHQGDPHLALREGWFSADSIQIDPDEYGWIKLALKDEESVYWLFDLGRDYTCQGWAEIEHAAGGEQLSVSYQEKIRNGELVISDPRTYCRVRLTDRFHLRAGAQIAETFALRGGRYLIFQLVGPTGAGFRLRLHARVAEYPLQITHPLVTTDSQLAGIINMCETTMHACLQEGFVDCVWRESSQWLGDALPQSLVMAAMSDDPRPLRQVIKMAAEGAYSDGVLPSVLPGEVHAYAVVDYNFTWVELLSLYWKLRGDDGLVRQMWPALIKMLDRFHQDRNESGLIISQPGRRLFLDWAPLSRGEPNAVYNLRYLLALQKAAQLADDRGLISDEARFWRDRALDVQHAIQANFWHNGRWYDDIKRTTFSQLAVALALLTQTTAPDQVETQLDQLTARSLDPDDSPTPDKMVLVSPFMHHYIFEALRQHRRFETVVEIIRLRWGRWVEAGYPTTWENWNVDFPDGSQCHAFSAHPRYHLAEIARETGGLLVGN